jgi:alpha-1,6-mannosyltransferase
VARDPVKTLHLTNAWHATSGGIGTFYKALFDAANRDGHWMRLIVPGPETRVEKVGMFGLIYHLQAGLAPFDNSYRMLLPHRYLFPGTAIQRIINHESPDLIEISEKYTLPYLGGLIRTGRLPGVRLRPAVVGASHERMDENMAAYLSGGRSAAQFSRWYMKWLYFPMFDHHITFSEHTATELIQASVGHKVRRGIWITPMGADCSLFSAPHRESHDGVMRLIYAGRLSPEKNVPLLLDVMERLSPLEFHLTIAGEGPLLAQMRGRELPHVTFAGHVADRAQLAYLYAGADIFVHPNPREPFGIAPLEAMAAGLALVAPCSGGVTSYANETNAWLVPADAASFSAAVLRIRDNPAERAARINAARDTALEHDWPVVTSRFLKLYTELTALTKDSRLQSQASPRLWSTGTKYSQNV